MQIVVHILPSLDQAEVSDNYHVLLYEIFIYLYLS